VGRTSPFRGEVGKVWSRRCGDPGGGLTYCRDGGHAEGRVNLGRASSIGRRRISRWRGVEGGGAGRRKISRGRGGGGALRRSMK
jgi:hypothetical protein